MTGNPVYEEKLSSSRTEVLFLGLTAVFLALFLWRVSALGLDVLGIVLLVLCAMFLFYSVNYRTLIIRISPDSLILKFGVFAWTIPFDNIEECRADDSIPASRYYGGAGIHFMFVRGRYRASFNFLEYPRVVIVLKRKKGSVRDVSFSTRQPSEVIRILQKACSQMPA